MRYLGQIQTVPAVTIMPAFILLNVTDQDAVPIQTARLDLIMTPENAYVPLLSKGADYKGTIAVSRRELEGAVAAVTAGGRIPAGTNVDRATYLFRISAPLMKPLSFTTWGVANPAELVRTVGLMPEGRQTQSDLSRYLPWILAAGGVAVVALVFFLMKRK
jgi:hypothetical protein